MVVSKTKLSKTKTEARSTQISKTEHPRLENEAYQYSVEPFFPAALFHLRKPLLEHFASTYVDHWSYQ